MLTIKNALSLSKFTHTRFKNFTLDPPLMALVLPSNAYVFTLVYVTLSMLVDYFGYFMISLIVNYLIYQIIWPPYNERRKFLALCLTTVLCLFNMSRYVGVINIYLVSHAQGKVRTTLLPYFEQFYALLEKMLGAFPSVAYPKFGVNASPLSEKASDLVTRVQHSFEPFVEGVRDSLSRLMLDVTIQASYLRPCRVNPNPIPMSAKPPVDANAILDSVGEAQQMFRKLFLVGSFALAYLLSNIPSFLICCILFWFYRLIEVEVKSTIDFSAKAAPIKNGVFLVETFMANWQISHGIGVSWNNILHVPYHVCNARNIRIGGAVYRPHTIDPQRDLVTYNGPPQFSTPPLDTIVYVNCEDILSSTTYEVPISIDMTSAMMTWIGVTSPGESGSPVLTIGDDGVLRLVGLAGRYLTDSTGASTEFSEIPVSEETSSCELYHRITSHPGSGKTRRVIPELIINYMNKYPMKKVLVTGPTRVVCYELFRALQPRFTVGLNTKDMQIHRNPHAPIQIAAHQTMLLMLLSHTREIANAGCMIIDEAHFDDPSTIMLRRFGQYMVSDGKTLYELSATLDGYVANQSCFPITDIQITDNNVIDVVSTKLEEGKRVMIFVPSLKNTFVRTLLNRFSAHSPIALSRDTFVNTMPMVKNVERKLIFATNIAECGINVPDLEVVVDLGSVFSYVEDHRTVTPGLHPISEASGVQRRGRVGRSCPGTYYYIGERSSRPLKSAAQFDAEVMMTGRHWSPDITNDWGIKLSDNQVITTLRCGYTPTFTYLTTDSKGTKVPEPVIYDRIQSLRRGHPTIYYVGCGERGCLCSGQYTWFDERIHNLIIGRRLEPKVSSVHL